MAQATFELTTLAAVDADFAYRFLLDPNNQRHLQPEFVQAELVRTGTNACGQIFQDYRITERPRLAFVRYHVNVWSRLVFNGPYEYTTDMNTALGAHLSHHILVDRDEGATRIVEEVRIDAPWLTISYVRRQAYLEHRRKFDRLPGVLEALYRSREGGR